MASLLNLADKLKGFFGQAVQQAPRALQAFSNPVAFAGQQLAQQPRISQPIQNFVQQTAIPQANTFAQSQMNKPIAPYAPSFNQIRQFNQGLNNTFNGGKTGAERFAEGLVQLSKPGELNQDAINSALTIAPGTVNSITRKISQKAGQAVGNLAGKMPSENPLLNAISRPENKGNILQQTSQLPGKIKIGGGQLNTPNGTDDILRSGYAEIGSLAQAPKKSLGQKFDEFYTNWVDRFNPIVKAAEQVEKKGKAEGFILRPENNPKYTLKKFLGMGGIAEQRYNTELKPVLDQIDQFKIPQQDMDLYLKSRRDINLGQRGIKGSDANLGTQRSELLEAKYPQLKQVADQLYSYQSKGFQELADAGFFSPEVAQSIKNTNADYVPFQRVMDQLDEYLGIPSKSVQQGTNPIKGIKGSDKQIYSPIESIIANTFKQRAAIEKNNVMKSLVGLQQVMPELGFLPATKAGSNTVSVWQNGHKLNYEVGADIAEAVKGLNEENMNSFLKILEYPASLLRQGATGRNPEFMLPNMIRDQFDAATNSQYGYTPFLDWAKGLAHIARRDDIYQAWLNSGGSQVMSSMSGRKSVQAMLNEKNVQKRIIPKLFGWLGSGLDKLGAVSEQPTRVGLFANAYKKTGNPLIGAMESREGTLDFSRMGAKMKVANSIVPFLNVGIQGFDKMLRTAKSNPAKFAFNMGLYGATPAVMTTLYNVTNHPQEYAEIPQFVKDDNFVIVTGRNAKGTVDYISIPKGNVIRYVANPTESFISYLAGTNPQSLSEFATQFISSGLPVVGDGSSIKEVAIKTIGQNLPQAIKPATENLINKSFYKYDPKKEQSKEIVPYYLNSKPAGDRSYEFTPVAYQAIGKALNVSPLQVQNALEGYLAGYVKIPVNLIQNFNNMAEGKDVEKNRIPLMRRFIQETYPTSSSNPSIVSFEQAQSGTPTIPNKERADLLSKASAAEFPGVSKKQVEAKKLSDQAEKALRDQVKTTGQTTVTSDSVYYLTATGKVAEVSKDFSVEQPKLTGQKELDKSLISSFKGEITSKKNAVKKLYELGQLTADEANAEMIKLDQLSKIKSSGGSGKKGTKSKGGKVTIQSVKAPRTTIRKSVIRAPGFKLRKSPTFKLSKPKTSNVKLSWGSAKVSGPSVKFRNSLTG